MKILPGGGADEGKIGVEQVRECSKLLALHHSEMRRESGLRAVYKKYSKIENGGGVALVSAKSLLVAAPLSVCLSDLTGNESFLRFENFLL
ncbi:hypothetical protein Bca52824_015964 [Brassica carinata]|uniref:Uncharacterized protein n=1 Tax=Brassica carinata TaxID=52824 RepID=A0A8X7W497_BRACI|nr:hypothetical protein Bca52824_015964 [Brassica carinata]